MGSGWSSEEEERQPLLGPGLGPAPGTARRGREAAAVLPAAGPGPGRVYGRRWLVLLLFSLLAFAQGLVWNTWGPIQNSARQAYGFSGWDIALLVLWGPIGFLPCFAFMWLLDKREFGVVCLIFSATLAYFPPRPPLPPSVAAASQRLSYRRSFCRLLSNLRFLMIALAYAIPLGVFAGWSGVLDLILTPVHVSQVDAGWIGFWSIVGGCVVGIAIASSVPIFFELFVETVYPVPEGITCGVVTFLSNMFMGVLLFFLTFYHTELSWFNWCLPGSCLLSLLLILCFRESYDRLYLDVVVSV
ncbi:Slc49a4 [Phodopus roborovskii]|uniref:Slc49a4 protein n=1 Tax=Phodopus roborovskii TaxID=109678 RepID=A0AAU9ZJT1_PHORO|nr:Slc49a4 [Phodopus roborovskii]